MAFKSIRTSSASRENNVAVGCCVFFCFYLDFSRHGRLLTISAKQVASPIAEQPDWKSCCCADRQIGVFRGGGNVWAKHPGLHIIVLLSFQGPSSFSLFPRHHLSAKLLFLFSLRDHSSELPYRSNLAPHYLATQNFTPEHRTLEHSTTYIVALTPFSYGRQHPGWRCCSPPWRNARHRKVRGSRGRKTRSIRRH